MHYLILADGVAINFTIDFCNPKKMFFAMIIMIAAQKIFELIENTMKILIRNGL